MDYVPPTDMTSMQEFTPMPNDACEDPDMEPMAWFGIVCAIVLIFAFAFAEATVIWEICK